MVSYEQIREMPLSELLQYFNAASVICEKIEREMKPLFNSNSPKEQLRWVELNNEYQHSRLYYDVVLNALKYKVFNGLDNYTKPVKEDKSVVEKKPTSKTTGKKKKESGAKK